MDFYRYPIYRIPTGPTLKDLDACFLTFHSLYTSLGGNEIYLAADFFMLHCVFVIVLFFGVFSFLFYFKLDLMCGPLTLRDVPKLELF